MRQPEQLVRHVRTHADDAPWAAAEVVALLNVTCPLRAAVTAAHRAALAPLLLP